MCVNIYYVFFLNGLFSVFAIACIWWYGHCCVLKSIWSSVWWLCFHSVVSRFVVVAVAAFFLFVHINMMQFPFIVGISVATAFFSIRFFISSKKSFNLTASLQCLALYATEFFFAIQNNKNAKSRHCYVSNASIVCCYALGYSSFFLCTF